MGIISTGIAMPRPDVSLQFPFFPMYNYENDGENRKWLAKRAQNIPHSNKHYETCVCGKTSTEIMECVNIKANYQIIRHHVSKNCTVITR